MQYNKMKLTKSMKSCIKQPEILIALVYLICFSNGLVCLFFKTDISQMVQHVPSFCIFSRITGWHCPGCGMTRAFISLGQFRIIEGFQYNIFSPFLFYGGLCWLMLRKKLSIELGKPVAFLGLLLVFIYGIIRNI